MDDIELNNDINEPNVEITDLDPIEKNGTFASLRIATHTLFTKIPWQRIRVPVQRIVLLLLILLVPLIISLYSHPSVKSITAHECMRKQVRVVYVARETITSSGTTLTEIAVPVPSNSKWLYDVQCV